MIEHCHAPRSSMAASHPKESNMRKSMLSFAITLPLFTALAAAQTLAVGADAPPLQIEKWVKGDPIESFAPGKIYVVEFWATWCGPCIAGMPHLSKLQAAYKDKGVTIIGTSSADRNNTLAKVEAMVADKGDVMAYTVAWDDGRKTNEAYMKASGQKGIPCAFLIDGKGKVAYIGHPAVLDIPLAGVIDGTWDAAKGDEIIAAAMQQMEDVVEAVSADATKGKVALDAFATKYPMLVPMVDQQVFPRLLKDGKSEQAYAVAGRLIDHAIADKDPMALNDVAWAIVDPDTKLAKRDLDLALKAAAQAVELSQQKDGAILDTLARVWFWKQDYHKALELQKKAVAADDRADLKPALKEYEQLVEKAKAPDVK